MRDDESESIAATFAFLFYRRKHEFDMGPSTTELAFVQRLQVLCAGLLESVEDGSLHESPELISTLLMNYLATVWLTWETMATEADDPLGVHNLSPDEAQLGVLLLLERARITTGRPG
jgi:hypothetical protein